MMHFCDRDSPHPLLEIVSDDQQNPNAKVLLLEVQRPAIGVFSLVCGAYDESLLLKEWSKMDTKDVMRNFSSKATSMKVPLRKYVIHHDATSSKSIHSDGSFNNWRVPSSNFGNVCYTPGYWEWVEDVLSCHKEILELIKVYGNVYTSLFTYDYDDNVLHVFVNFGAHLPIRFLLSLKRCPYHFGTYKPLEEVSIHDWVKFWFRGPNRYAEPPQKVSKVRATKPRFNHNPSRHIDSNFLPWTDEENAPFVELDVEESLRDETNLAAFFACWICKFVLPNKKDDARHLHHLAMLQGRDLHLTDNGKLSNSWNEYIISLRSGYVTLRHDSNFIVESYNPIRFSRQFGFCQDVPRDLMEYPYDEGAPLMTRKYVDWWPSQRMNTSQGNLCIILKKTKQDSTSMSSKGASNQSNKKSHPSSKSQVKSNDTLQVAKTSSKSKTSKDGDVPPKSKLRRLTLASQATSPASKVGNGSFGTNELHVSSDNGNDQTSNLETPCDEISHMYASPDGVGQPNASSNTIIIDDNNFVDEDPNSASLSELAKQLDLQELYGGDLNNGAIADFTVDFNDLDAAAKDFHSSINDYQPSLEVVSPRKSPSSDMMPSLEVVPPRKSPSRPLRPGGPTFEPQETIYRVKSTFVSEMWGALCGWITQFSLGSLDGFTELELSIASTLEEIRKVNIIDVSSLEDLVENFFKSYAEYDTLRSSKMTKESHEKSLSDVQRRLDDAKLAHEKLDGSMEKLQETLADVEKDLKALTSKKKKVTALINKYQEKLPKSQENVTIMEGEIYTIEANNVMSNDEVERLTKLEGAVKKSRQEMISFKLFP
ncbi:hypothetical protein H5410_051303 [Solanum commersonii]|uniref:Aminotransferase-like plant mobile domain-containing protein n=1 Tax=Solanum commersonii TaxID=4109 RepID=A0A9J5X051_SOLCO|nr:hypothetical protein H5410_051303 [Solanum commersonii]